MNTSEFIIDCDPDENTTMAAVDLNRATNSAFLSGLLSEDSRQLPNASCLQRVGDNDHANAIYRAAVILYLGIHGVQQNPKEALKLFQLIIESQDNTTQSRNNVANAYYYIARIYYHGLGVKRDLEKAFQMFKISAGKGQREAQCQLGYMYCSGEILPKDNAIAFQLFEKAANQGDHIAQNNLAVFYTEGRVSKPDRNKAFFWFQKAAKNKNPIIQLNFGEMFRQGLEGNIDHISALYWMQLSGSQRCSKAQYEVGLCHLYGHGTEKNSKQAILWLTKAVNNDGNPAALYALGLMHMQGLGIRRNSNAAFKYFMESSRKSYSEGQTQLGLCYLNGIGTTKDLKKAKECFEKAAHNDNNSAAQYYLGCLYFTGQGVKVNRKLAFHWYLKSAFQGFPDAQNAVGECYMNGQGTRQDYEKSLFWFKSSISINGNAASQYNLGLMYYFGRGVEVDYDYAFYDCFIKSAEKGFSNAENQVGHCYSYGHGTPQDFERAMYWYRKSLINNANASAQCSIGKLHLNGLGVEKDLKLAFCYFSKSAEQQCSDGQYMLGKCHEKGYGTPQNYDKAMSCYQDAENNDKNARAQYRIGCLYSQGHGVPHCIDLSKFWFQQSADQGFVRAQQELAKYEVRGSEKSAGSDIKRTPSKLHMLKRDETSIETLPLSSHDEKTTPEDGIKNSVDSTSDPSRNEEPDKFFHV